MDLAPPLHRVIQALRQLPGVGQKSAQRMAFYLMRSRPEQVTELAEAIAALQAGIRCCGVCQNLGQTDPCHFCADSARNRTVICVVQEPNNILAVEKSRQYNGLYHVLHGAISPLQGVGPDQLRIPALLRRLGSGESEVEEIILATNPNAEGEATALYLANLLKPLGLRISRIGVGVPVGSEIEYADEVTMGRALEGRRTL